MNSNPFVAKWTAVGHTLCLGQWEITYKGEMLDLPSPRANKEMNTHGNFSWMFPDDDEFVEGLPFELWVEENIEWLIDVFIAHEIPTDPQYVEWFYLAVNEQDWTCNSCGGCI